MNSLDDLYQEVILDHNRRPRNFGEIANASHHAEGYNPLCGDKVTVSLKLVDDHIAEIRFKGSGCAISTASASLMTELLKGREVHQALLLFKIFHRLVLGQALSAEEESIVGKLSVFSGVSEYPVRVKCATLAWHTLRAALEREGEPVSTE